MQKFSWTCLDDGRVAKELDFSSFNHNGTGVPKEFHSFFGVKDKTSFSVILNGMMFSGDGNVGGKNAFRASLDWDNKGRLRLFWRGSPQFQESLKNKFSRWENIKPHSRSSSMKMVFKKTSESKAFDIELFDEESSEKENINSEALIASKIKNPPKKKPKGSKQPIKISDFKFGHPVQHEVGSIFESRKALSDACIHRPPMHGIWGRQKEGACSIVMPGGYEDDIDELDYILYTGHGGQDVPGGKQIKDQEFSEGNLALKLSYENKLPIRVTRGFQIENGPRTGYRYDGIYYINHIERVIGRSGYFVYRFHLQSDKSIENLENLLADKLKPTYQRTTRTKLFVSKVDRNPLLPDKIKELYGYRCQVCNCRFEKPNGAIAVGAHVRALGRPHDGPDDISNLICLCPNHHAQFDAFAFYIDATTLEIKGLKGFKGGKLNVSKKHKINSEFFAYHAQLYEKTKRL